MNSSCKLQSNPDGTPGYTLESVLELNSCIMNQIESAIDNSEDGTNAVMLKHLIKIALKNIRKTYLLDNSEILASYIKNFLDSEYEGVLDDFLPELGLINFLDSDEKSSRELLPLDYSQEIDEDISINSMASQFLDDFFGPKPELKNKLKLKVTHEILNTFIVNRKEGKLVSNSLEANQNARIYKQLLFENIINYSKKDPELSKLVSNLPENLLLYDEEGNYTGILLDISVKLILVHFDALSSADLQIMHDTNENRYNAIIDYFILKNYDKFINYLLGDAITVSPDSKFTFGSENPYGYSTKSTALITSYRTTDNVVMESEINKLAQALINSTPFYKKGVNTKSNKFISFEDFYRVITKIKNLPLNENAFSIIISNSDKRLEELFSDPSLTPRDLELIRYKSLASIVNNIRTEPLTYLRLTFKILSIGNFAESLGFTEEERDKCYSIYKGFFDGNNKESLFKIQDLDIYDHNSLNYYELITLVADSMFSVDYILYNLEEGMVKVRTLKDLGIDLVRKRLEYNYIQGLNTKRRLLSIFEESEMTPYKFVPILGENSLIILGINYSITSNLDVYDLTYNLESNTLSISKNNIIITNPLDISLLLDLSEFKKFLDTLLHLNLLKDQDLLEALLVVSNGSEKDQISSETFMDLMKLASEVFLNKYVSNIKLKDVNGKSKTKSKLKDFYPNKDIIPTYNINYGEINLFSKRLVPILNKIASAMTIVTGEAQSAQVRTANGDMLSSQTLSRLLGNLTSQWQYIKDLDKKTSTIFDALDTKKYKGYNLKLIKEGEVNPNSQSILTENKIINLDMTKLNSDFLNKHWTISGLASDGSIYRALPKHLFSNVNQYISFLIEREILKDTIKRPENMPIGEYINYINSRTLADMNFGSAAAEFELLDPGVYQGFFTAKELRTPYGNKDHTQFTVAESLLSNFLYDFVGGFLDFNDPNNKAVIGNGKIGLLPSVNSDKNTIGRAIINLKKVCTAPPINGTKTYKELTNEELQLVTMYELNNAYTKSFANIICDYKFLETWVREYEHINVVLNPENDFKEFNEYCQGIGKDALDVLNSWTNKFNNSNSKNIKLIDLVHYMVDKSRKGCIKFNGTMRALLNRYSNPKEFRTFMALKESELLKSLLDENVQFNLYQENPEQSPKTYLLGTYPDWVNKIDKDIVSGEVLKQVNNKLMVLAKITVGNIQYSITKKSDLKEIGNNLGVNFLLNPHELFNPKLNIKFELHPMLKLYNSFDYLFTQEFMIAGVGSHMAHPFKKSHKTPILWVHPAMGKTYTVRNSDYNERIMDWDDEFNAIRDRWIAAKTSTKKGTPEFKASKNEYLINWRNHEDFKDFVKRLWEIIKHRAYTENKMLVASPAMLLEMFPKDFNKVISMSRDEFVKRGLLRGDLNPQGWKDGIDAVLSKTDVPIEYAGENEYLLNMLENGKLYSELNKLHENEMEEEATRFLALHKRNVSYTAAMHEFLLNQIDGIPTEYNMAIMKDIKAPVYTVSGDTDPATPFDGATFVNPWIIEWENNSLKGDKAGIDKKLFVHYYDELTGTGGIIKTAGFGVTNDRVRRYSFYRTMIYNMTKRVWKNEDGSIHTVREGGILKDYNGKTVDYGPVFFKKGGKYFMRYILSYEGNNTYNCELVEVDKKGNPITESVEEQIKNVESNYDIWQMFGGEKSLEIGKNGTLQYSEHSRLLTALACNNYGTIKPGVSKVRTAEDLNQPMKHSDIHYMPTEGAVKLGLGNINSTDLFYNLGSLNFIKVVMRLAGILLDKEHHADNAKLSLMTLVISAACAKGYSQKYAKRLYDALYKLTKVSTKEFRNEMGDLISFTNPKSNQIFDSAVTGILMKSILNSTSLDGDMVQAIAHDIIYKLKRNSSLKEEEAIKLLDETIPYSDPTIYNKIVTSLTVALTKSGIKTKMEGVLSVLCPAHDIVKFYKIPVLDKDGNVVKNEDGSIKYKRVTREKVEDLYDLETDSDFENQLEAILMDLPNILDDGDDLINYDNISKIEMGYKYLITDSDNNTFIAHVTVPCERDKSTGKTTFYLGKELEVREIGYATLKKMQTISILEWIKDGQDLKSYNVHFQGTNGKTYQLADLDIVLDYFRIKQIDDQKEQLLFISKLLDKYNKLDEFKTRLADDLSHQKILDISEGSLGYLLESIKTDSIENFLELLKDPRYKGYSNIILPYLSKFGQKFLNRVLQINLDSLSKEGLTKVVRINDKLIEVNKDTVDIRSYGIIMPKTCKSNLGLEDFDDVEQIKNNPYFFVERLAKKMGTKVEIVKDPDTNKITNPFHLELKRADGNHIYIRKGLTNSGLEGHEIKWFKRINSKGEIFRVDEDDNIMYRMYSEDDKIYQDADGNEIIVTSDDNNLKWETLEGLEVEDPEISEINGIYIDQKTGNLIFKIINSPMKFYLDHMDYLSINISRACSKEEFLDILEKAENSNNKNAVRTAEMIKKVGINQPDPVKRYEAYKKFSNKLNNYEALLKDPEYSGFAMQHLKDIGELMHTSFLQMLNIIAARIPSLNLQSFMSMEVEAFDNPDINTAYVSIFLFYLLGSDLDIDAVSLQTFELDRNGLFLGHSPFYSLKNKELRKASEEIPFPTGLELNVDTTEKIEDDTLVRILKSLEHYIGLKDKGPLDALILLAPMKDKTIKISLNLNSKENIAKLSKLITILSEEGFKLNPKHHFKISLALNTLLIALNPSINNGDNTLVTLESHIGIIEKFLIDTVNKHNEYLNKVSLEKKESILKNYVTTLLFNIILDPINLILALSSVDVVTGPAKELAKSSPKATVQNTFTPGNVANKFLSINENMVGKDGIAICATGLKSYFALTLAYSQMLSGEYLGHKITLKDLSNLLLFNVEIGGKVYNGLANGFTNKFKSFFESDPNISDEEWLQSQQELDNLFGELLEKYLLDQLWASDAANDMSALLGLSVDNAKELILAKMNAGTSSIGMYLYGLSIGMSFDDLYKIMTSPLAFRLSELTRGNSFNNDDGTYNFTGALNYLGNDPRDRMARFNNITLNDPTKTKPVDLVFNNLLKYLNFDKANLSTAAFKNLNKQGLIHYALNTLAPEEIIKDLEKIRSWDKYLINNIKDDNQASNYDCLYNLAIDFLEDYINDFSLTRENNTYQNIYGTLDIYKDLLMLAQGAEEMKAIGGILRLNQEIKTNSADVLLLIRNIEDCIVNRYNQLKQYATRNKLSDEEMLRICLGYSSRTKIDSLKIDVEEFATNPEYAQEKINLYNVYKHSYNPLLLLKEVPHYKGYFESLFIAYKGLKNKSVKFRLMDSRSELFADTYKVRDSKLKQLVVKNIESFTDTFMRLSWMQNSSRGIFTIPANLFKDLKILNFLDSKKYATQINYDREIQLGTDLGDANFKLFMELTLIPYLQEEFPDNKFLTSLQPVLNTRTNVGVNSLNFSLPINMLPKTDLEKDIFNEYKRDFNKLKQITNFLDATGKTYSYIDLFYIYSLICNNGKLGPNSLHSIFEDMINEDILIEYREYISQVDSNPESFEIINLAMLDMYIAPIVSPYKGGSLLLRWKNSDTNAVDIWIKKKKELKLYSNEDEDAENDNNEAYLDLQEENLYEDGDYDLNEYYLDPYYDEENQQDDTEVTEINNYIKENVSFGSLNTNFDYFYNFSLDSVRDIDIISMPSFKEDFLKTYPSLSKFLATFEIIRNNDEITGFGLLSLDALDAQFLETADKYLKYIRAVKPKDLVKIVKNGDSVEKIVNYSKLDSDLESLLNGCITL